MIERPQQDLFDHKYPLTCRVASFQPARAMISEESGGVSWPADLAVRGSSRADYRGRIAVNHMEIPPLFVLGVCDHIVGVQNVVSELTAVNIANLRAAVLAPFLPIDLRGLTLVVAVHVLAAQRGLILICEDEKGEQNFSLKISLTTVSTPGTLPRLVEQGPYWPHTIWTIMPIAFPEGWGIFTEPQILHFSVVDEGAKQLVGGLTLGLFEPPPLTDDRIAAIRSDPHATQTVQVRIGCKSCGKQLAAYASFQRKSQLETDGVEWYRNLPERFTCQCGSASIDLRPLRENLHALLGGRFRKDSDAISFTRLYEASSIEAVYDKCEQTLQCTHLEAPLQTLIEENPILLHQFSAQRIIKKAKILDKFISDFSVLTAGGELVLIEIEPASHRLLKKNGHPTAFVTHAIEQVNDWLHVFRSHRIACLDCMGLRDEQVGRVRGVVVIGRAAGHDRSGLRRLCATDYGNVTVMTYDDLLNGLAALITELRRGIHEPVVR